MKFSEKVSKGTQENCLAIKLYASKKFFPKKHTHTHTKGPLKLMTFLSQIIYLVYVKICGTKSMI